ncbi:hypothetical protein BO94DRAFT_553404 [Aspergillus sclerotioniger CBS 115572]|uniref:Uncharacterized protein n=1 Tax=Aspergillus sclerotioniger CBS 115572 TaxID=1450535 RepID=A0A317XD46_9EURO|nr:hypothetical protein BO94DRAFT_553404 [Aspergillus sclerotioniger CBS 115572]PWY94460.1 hypothetical protein BO94DRAFT_553404 [Aspergillus sclerotioniger CBS 115572]
MARWLQCERFTQKNYADIELTGFRHLMDFLVMYASTEVSKSVPDLQYQAPAVVRGVKICSHGEIKLHRSEPFGKSISPIFALLGTPLIFWKDPDAEFHHNPPGWNTASSVSSNENAAYMMMETNPSEPSWGWAPLYWNRDIGNGWVVREDGQDLDVRDVAMMCYFARHKLQPMFEDTITPDSRLQDKKRVLSFITPENMRAYWKEIGGDEAFRSHDNPSASGVVV